MLGQNFGIIVVFGVGFIAMLLAMTEINTSSSGQSSVTLFKRGAKRAVRSDSDEENRASDDSAVGVEASKLAAEAQRQMDALPAVKNTFSFEGLTYVVPVKSGKRKLLDGVSGYVAPGKLTALMGESGAGKVRGDLCQLCGLWY